MSAPHLPHLPHRPTIGMLTAWLSGPTEIQLWHGVADRTLERSVNLLCFSGGIPGWHQQFEAQKNILFDIAGRQNVDGLLIWSNILSHTLDRPSLEAFCRHYAPLPIFSMGMVLPAIPSIRIDMRAGMQQLLSHLIEEHGRRKIAFIRGLEVSQDAEDRFQAYCETLAQYGLGLDPDLIVPGNFRRGSGVAAVAHLIDESHKDFDALVSANDNMAIGAMQALQARGIQIPDDVIVAGFDNIEETIALVPSLTTVRAPWHTLGSKSVDLMLSILAGEPAPEQILLPAELIARQSCGCHPIPAKDFPMELPSDLGELRKNKPPQRTALTSIRSRLLKKMDTLLGTTPAFLELDRGWSEQLFDSFLSDAQSGEDAPSRFIQNLVWAFAQIPSGAQIIEWQELLDLFRANLRLLFHSKDQQLRAHTLLEKGYALTGEIAHRRQLSQRLEAENQTDRLNRIVQTLSTTYETESLMKLLALELPGLGIQSCFLALYDEKGDLPAWSRLIMASTEKERLPLEAGGMRFATRKLAPPGMLPQDRRFAYDVEALYFQDEQIGFVLFEIGPRDGDVYTALRGHLSSALKSAELVQVALDAEAKAKKADQLKTHLLANVSHELRTPINIILGLSQMALSTPNPYGIDLPSRLTQDLGYIYDSGEHLVRLINDLLDMSRAEIGELDLTFEPVTPRSLLYETFHTIQEISPNKQKNVALRLEIPDHLPLLHADPVRLRQILMNLLSNAYKFTQQGTITLGAEIQLPHLHIWVADTGMGIPLELQEGIFEAFVKVDPPGQRRSGIGLGLSITRRLVALHSGSITLESQPGLGSTFHIYLPLPGVNSASAKTPAAESAPTSLGWISSQRIPPQAVLDLCQKKGLDLCWLGNIDDLDELLQNRRPAGLAWDLDHVRPGDWFMVQKVRGYPQFCHLPLLLFQGSPSAKTSTPPTVTNVLLKPAGKQTLQHILDLLPQAAQAGEIWIVDDDAQAIRYYQDMISASIPDFLVRAVPGGREALQLLSQAAPDLMILDLMMPEVDGFQVLAALRGNPKTASIPVIILTGKMLSYEDVKRLDAPKVVLQTKGILSAGESASEVQRILMAPSPLPQPTSLLVKQALAYIHQNYTRVFSLQELAETIGVSKSYLSRIFKLDLGVSLWDYLNRLRIHKARELLLLNDQSITAVAACVGFEDVGYFGRVFREVSGCSPRAFKQQGREPGSPGQ